MDDREVHRASSQFQIEHPYVQLVRRGSCYPPPEAGFEKDPDEQANENEGGEDSKGGRGEGTLLKDQAAEGSPASPATPGDFANGIKWHVKIFTDDFSDPKHCTGSGELKSRRPIPHIKASELVAGLRKIDGDWIFEGPLNGWPALRGFALRSLTHRVDRIGLKQVHRIWGAEDGRGLPAPADIPKRTRATFMAPSWSAIGWAPDSPGFVWWFSDRDNRPRLLYGEQMLDALRKDPSDIVLADATHVHAFAHRYPVEHETWEESQTWHCGILIEWSHGLFTTLLEFAWKNGCGGYGGKSNWCEDKLESVTAIFRAMADNLKQPWDQHRAEIRLIDMAAKSKEEFVGYLHKYGNKSGLPLAMQRFWDPEIYESAPVRLRGCRPADLAGFVLNYAQRAYAYDKLRSNCQTFTADLFGFLAGAKGRQPFSPAVRKLGLYQQRTMSFLYRPDYRQ